MVRLRGTFFQAYNSLPTHVCKREGVAIARVCIATVLPLFLLLCKRETLVGVIITVIYVVVVARALL